MRGYLTGLNVPLRNKELSLPPPRDASGNHRKSHGKSRSHSKTRVSKGDPSDGSHLDIPAEREYEFYDPLTRSPREGCFIIEHKGDNFIMHSNPSMIESHFPMTPEWDVSGELAKEELKSPGRVQHPVQKSFDIP